MAHAVFELGGNPNVTLKMFPLKGEVDGPKPLVIVCPGGGFLDCSAREGSPVARMFNRAGYHAALLTYTNHAVAPETPGYPQALYDLAEAVLLVREHASEWQVNPDQIVLCGFSAGGWLCSMYGNLWETDFFAAYGTPEQRKPNAAVLGYPLVDYHVSAMVNADSVSLSAILGGMGEEGMKAFKHAMDHALLGDAPITAELLDKVSPVDHIGPNTPPAFVWTTFGDGMLEPSQSIAYASRLHEQGIPSELHVFKEGFHGLSLATEAIALKESQINPHVARWAELACEWLELLFKE